MIRRLDVALLPRPLDSDVAVAVVVDVLRASTSLVTLVERGSRVIRVAPTVEAARRAAAVFLATRPAAAGAPGAAGSESPPLLIGEQASRRPEGFDYGNSPVELAHAHVAGRQVVFATTNGAPALFAASSAGTVLVGCLRNATAAARAAWEASGEGDQIVIVCAGRKENPGDFGIDDLYAAGAIVERLRRTGKTDLADGAEAALLVASGEVNALDLFRRSAAGRYLDSIGLGSDVAYSAEVERSTAVPRLGRDLVLIETA